MTAHPFALARSLLVLLYSAAMSLIAPLLGIAARFNPRLRLQLEGRKSVSALTRDLVHPRNAKRRCAIFFCSSAGEFEQARPLVDRLERRGDVFVHVFFFSRSGAEFARARGETVSYSLAPAVDSVWAWGNLFSALRPDVVAVVRHELWPAFLETARHFARLYLIDASRSAGEATSGSKRFARGQLLSYFDAIYAVSPADARFFRDNYSLGNDRVVVTGDTKYDRVRERALAKVDDARRLDAQLGGDAARRLVLGSAHKPDVEAWLDAWRTLGAETAGWQVVIAPHHVDDATVGDIVAACERAGLEVERFSALAGAGSGARRPPVVVVDAMGRLAEIYGASALAYVGGALHHQVHNVLEPACHGLALAFGPRHETSAEAVRLAQAGLADVCDGGAALAAWWRQRCVPDAARKQRLADEVTSLCGASDTIMAAWGERLVGSSHA